VTDRSVPVTVVIPLHNEEDILASTTETVLAGFRGIDGASLVDLILSENGSRDRTRDIAAELAAQHSEIRVLISDLPDYGAALRRGFAAARGELIVNFDADYYDFDFVRAALAIEADIVVAAKNIAGSTDARMLVRRVGSRSFGWLVRKMLGIRTTETHGIKMYRRQAIWELLDDVRSTKDLFDTELVARAELSGLRVVEVPIDTKEMRHSRSGIFRRIPRTVFGLYLLRRRLKAEHRGAEGRSGERPLERHSG
jgi:glycosyltransferase involved in cell wall biosynthesis